MVEKQYGAVAVLDALGMKGIWQREQPEEIVKTWDDLMNIYQKVHSQRQSDKNGYKSKFFTFSDTVIITAVGEDIKKTLMEFSVDIGILLTHAMMNKFFFRGCITVGEFYVGEKIVIGKAIDEAAQYYTIPQWVGVSAGPEAYTILRKMGLTEIADYKFGPVYVPYDIPTKIGLEKGFAINMSFAFDALRRNFNKDLNLVTPNSLTELFENELNKTSELDVSFKIRNTLEYIDYANEFNKKFEADFG